jgi:RNA polymerase sigma factor (sigma-70 family)
MQVSTEAFAEIVERYKRAVYAVAFAGVRDRALADDVTQDTFVIAWRHLAELRDEQRLGAWLCGIARNRAREIRRKNHRETASEIRDAVHGTTPYDDLHDAESERIIADALGQVPDVYREPLVLYYYEERSIEDVARSLGISPATTNKRLSRGRRYLAERVATVERSLTRRGPSPTLAASVLAVIGVTAPAPHVDASPATGAKGSIMHKLAIAALATATIGGAATVVVVTTSHTTDAHAADNPHTSLASSDSAHADKKANKSHALCDLMDHLHGKKPSAAAAPSPLAALTATSDPNDCAAVGEHLADLQADATHGPDRRPDEATYDTCSGQYTSICETEHWSAERRSCTLAAGDLINAHLCAGHVAPTEPPAAIPENLTCTVLGPKLAATLQAAGMHDDVTDLGDQIAAACDVGNWSIDLRACFSNGTTVDALKACIDVVE